MLRFCFAISFLLCVHAYAYNNSVEVDLGDGHSLEEKVSSLQTKLKIATNQNKNLHAQLLDLEERIRNLNGKLQSIDHSNVQLSTKLQNLTTDTNNRLERLEKKSPREGDKSSNKGVNASMTKYYNMIEKKNFKGAIKGLEQYISSHHTSPTLGEAYYWLGYAYMSDQEYTKAIKMFVNSYNGYPKGPKAEYSLLNMSVSLYRVKEYKKACNLIKKLINTSQDKQILSLAQYEKKDFNCQESQSVPKVVKSQKSVSKKNNR